MWKSCRHCGHAVISRPRGLCWKCYYEPGVRDHYPVTGQGNGVKDINGNRPMPPWPTKAKPGSPEKVEVLCQRASKRWNLWHPGDAY